MDIVASARKHGVAEHDMIHAYRNHWRTFETDDPEVTILIGPAMDSAPLEIGVVVDEAGLTVIHAMPARDKFLRGWWKR